jgi:hypothetical protein
MRPRLPSDGDNGVGNTSLPVGMARTGKNRLPPGFVVYV